MEPWHYKCKYYASLKKREPSQYHKNYPLWEYVGPPMGGLFVVGIRIYNYMISKAN